MKDLKMAPDQMRAWLVLEGWRLFVWLNTPSWRLSKQTPGRNVVIWHANHRHTGRWWKGGSSDATDYKELPMDDLPDEEVIKFMEDMDHEP